MSRLLKQKPDPWRSTKRGGQLGSHRGSGADDDRPGRAGNPTGHLSHDDRDDVLQSPLVDTGRTHRRRAPPPGRPPTPTPAQVTTYRVNLHGQAPIAVSSADIAELETALNDLRCK